MVASRLALPKTSLVGFKVQRVASPSVVWLDGDTEEARLMASAYCAPVEGETGGVWLEGDEDEVQVERYGGRGVGQNGGGVRCGVLGDVQIKGVGKSVLASPRAPMWHSYGGARLDECLKEVVWTQVLQQILPHGVVSARGIVATGSSLPRPVRSAQGDDRVPRALLMRDPSVRVAHFLPCLMFDWHRVRATNGAFVSEFERSRLAALSLSEVLKAELGIQVFEECGGSTWRMLGVLVKRHAEQLARATVRKVAHGGLGTSNFCMNGAWLDFGASSTVSGYGPLITSGKRPHFMGQAAFVSEQLRGVGQELKRLGVRQRKEDADVDLGSEFELHHRIALKENLLHLSGFDKALLASACAEEAEELAECMLRVMESDKAKTVRLIRGDGVGNDVMPDEVGHFNLSRAMKACWQLRSGVGWEHPGEWVGDAQLANRLLNAHKRVCDQVLAETGGDTYLRVMSACVANAWRVNGVTRVLYRGELQRAIDDAIESGRSLQEFIEGSVSAASKNLANSNLSHQELGSVLSCEAFCSTEEGIVVNGCRVSLAEFHGLAREQEHAESAKGFMVKRDMQTKDGLHVGGEKRVSETDALVGECSALLASRRDAARGSVGYLEGVVREAAARGLLQELRDGTGDLVGFAALACVGPETERRFMETKRALPVGSEWLEGESWWVVDLVVPPGGSLSAMRAIASAVVHVERVRYVRRRRGKMMVKEMDASNLAGLRR